MEVKVSDKYVITKDKYQFIVRELYTVADKSSEKYGEERSRPIGYYKTISCLVEFLIRQEVAESSCNNFKDLEKLIKSFGKKCEDAFIVTLENSK